MEKNGSEEPVVCLNDLGFMVSDRLMILLEAQSTWTENILVRSLLYMAQTWRKYLTDLGENLYSSSHAKLPEPELYVIYTGDRKARPSELSLSEVFFKGKKCAVEVRAKIIYGEGEGDIITQYVTFCDVLKEQVKLHGKTQKALREMIRICKERDVLREYLEEREVEVMDIMTMLFDQETVTNTYINDVLRQGRAEGLKETAVAMLKEDVDILLISRVTGLSAERLKELQAQLES